MANNFQQLLRELGVKSVDVKDNYRPRVRNRRVKKSRSRKFLRRHTWDAYDNVLFLSKIMKESDMSDKKIFLGVSDFDDLVTSEVMQARVESGKETVMRETTVLANRSRWRVWAEEHFKDFLFVQTSSSNGFLIEEHTNNYIKFDVNSNSTTVRAFGDAEFAEDIVDIIENEFSVVTSYIEWVYGSDGNSVNVPLNRDRLPIQEMYPFLGDESLEDYYDRYMESSANILLLIGPPGTGKTTFIRGLLAHRNASAIVTYDAGILEKDGFFARFIEDDTEVMVLEDSDAFLKSRTDGNTMMHRFLNVGDGLVTTKGKKMIFSTNLPSIRDIDSALIRPGRCFDIVEFKPLSLHHANALAEKLGGKVPVRKAGEVVEYSLAELFNQQSAQSKTAQNTRKVGFL